MQEAISTQLHDLLVGSRLREDAPRRGARLWLRGEPWGHLESLSRVCAALDLGASSTDAPRITVEFLDGSWAGTSDFLTLAKLAEIDTDTQHFELALFHGGAHVYTYFWREHGISPCIEFLRDRPLQTFAQRSIRLVAQEFARAASAKEMFAGFDTTGNSRDRSAAWLDPTYDWSDDPAVDGAMDWALWHRDAPGPLPHAGQRIVAVGRWRVLVTD